MPEELDILIARYLDGSASDDEVNQLETRLETDRGTAGELYQAAFYDALLRDAMGAAHSVESQVGLDATAIEPKGSLSIASASAASARRSRFVQWGAIAACIVLTVGIGLRIARAPADHPVTSVAVVPTLAVSHVMFNGAGVSVDRAKGHSAMGPTGALSPEDGIRTASGATANIVYDEEKTRLTLGADSAVRLGDSIDGKTWQLLHGKVNCDVQHQTLGQTLVVATAEAKVAVIGTKFEVLRSQSGTRVQVREGTVQVTRIRDGSTVHVSGGQFVEIIETPAGGTPPKFGTTKPEGIDMGAFWSINVGKAGMSK